MEFKKFDTFPTFQIPTSNEMPLTYNLCMSLSEIGRRYAESLFQNDLEEIMQKHQTDVVNLSSQYAQHGGIKAGSHFTEYTALLVEHIRRLGDARMNSLLKAYEKSGVPFDDDAMHQIKDETIQVCHQQQHNAVGLIGPMIDQTFDNRPPAGLRQAVTENLVNGVSGVISRAARSLLIKRDEIALEEMKIRKAYAAGLGKKWDVFVCHASEDKRDFVGSLAEGLEKSGLSVWYDEFTLKVGDSLRKRIDEGLKYSRFGIVVLSHSFFEKNWPQQELDGLMSRQIAGTCVILPVWHNLTVDEVRSYSPMLSGLVATKSSEGLSTVVRKLRDAMGL